MAQVNVIAVGRGLVVGYAASAGECGPCSRPKTSGLLPDSACQIAAHRESQARQVRFRRAAGAGNQRRWNGSERPGERREGHAECGGEPRWTKVLPWGKTLS
jgi:hypothetical protein